jgi:hypothetical protein
LTHSSDEITKEKMIESDSGSHLGKPPIFESYLKSYEDGKLEEKPVKVHRKIHKRVIISDK